VGKAQRDKGTVFSKVEDRNCISSAYTPDAAIIFRNDVYTTPVLYIENKTVTAAENAGGLLLATCELLAFQPVAYAVLTNRNRVTVYKLGVEKGAKYKDNKIAIQQWESKTCIFEQSNVAIESYGKSIMEFLHIAMGITAEIVSNSDGMVNALDNMVKERPTLFEPQQLLNTARGENVPVRVGCYSKITCDMTQGDPIPLKPNYDSRGRRAFRTAHARDGLEIPSVGETSSQFLYRKRQSETTAIAAGGVHAADEEDGKRKRRQNDEQNEDGKKTKVSRK